MMNQVINFSGMWIIFNKLPELFFDPGPKFFFDQWSKLCLALTDIFCFIFLEFITISGEAIRCDMGQISALLQNKHNNV